MKITAREYALAAAKANRENKILRIKNGAFVFEDAPLFVDEEEVITFKEKEDGLGNGSEAG